MKNNSKMAGTSGTSSAKDLAVIFSNFGSQAISSRGAPQRVVTWTSPTFGQCAGNVTFVSKSGWVLVTLAGRDELKWVRSVVATNHAASAAIDTA